MYENNNSTIHNLDPHRYDSESIYNPYIAQEYISEHYHTFNITCSSTYEHNHVFNSKTIGKNSKVNTHTHKFEMRVETENGFHVISGQTGPAITIDGGHKHFLKGITTNDKNHIHFFEGYTSNEIK